MNRRSFLTAGTIAGVAGLANARTARAATSDSAYPRLSFPKPADPKSRLKLSASRWPWGKFTLGQTCQMCRDLGMQGDDLLGPDDWDEQPRYGLACSMAYAPVPHPH